MSSPARSWLGPAILGTATLYSPSGIESPGLLQSGYCIVWASLRQASTDAETASIRDVVATRARVPSNAGVAEPDEPPRRSLVRHHLHRTEQRVS